MFGFTNATLRVKMAWLLLSVSSSAYAGLELSHVLEIPGKHRLDASQFLAVHHNFYLGYAVVGAASAFMTIFASAYLVYEIQETTARVAAGVPALCFIGALILFASVLQPANTQISSWSPDALPPAWQDVRNRWEAAHAACFVLTVVGYLSALFIPALRARDESRRGRVVTRSA